MKCKADTQEIAGKLIPAIATTNAIIASIAVMQAIKILSTPNYTHTNNLYLRESFNEFAKQVMVPLRSTKNGECSICCSRTHVEHLNLNTSTVQQLVDRIKTLGFEDPTIIDNKGNILYPAAVLEGETSSPDASTKTLNDLKVSDNTRLTVVQDENVLLLYILNKA